MSNIGAKNRLVGFYRPSGETDAANEPVADPWELVKEKWAEIRGETGMGTVRAAAMSGGVNTPLDRYSFRVNYDTSLDITMQMRERDGTRYNIVSVRHDKADREWTDVVGETGGADG